MAGQAITVAGLLEDATARIAAALGLERREARLEAQILIARALGVNRAWLVAHDRDVPPADRAAAVEALVARREQGEPVAYILGEKEFFGRLFKVTPDVLIPRPETELLVEAALERLPKDRPARVLDLGTGSGCIAITIALERPDVGVTAVDIAPAALAIARENANRLGATVEFQISEWFSALAGREFDLIVSNPPYVEAPYPGLRDTDLSHEPRRALTSGQDGLDDIRRIVAAARGHLYPSGTLLLEHGWQQGKAVRDLLHSHAYTDVVTLCDHADHERCSAGKKPGSSRKGTA